MSIVGAAALVAIFAPGPGSGAEEPAVGAGGLDRYVSYVHVQEPPEPRIWLDGGVDPVLAAGDRVRIYYRTNADAYVAILQIDTDGTTRMLYPRYPTENHYARADRDYRLLFPRSAYWNVDDRPGVGYFFIVTSPTPFDLADFGYSHYDGGWDLSAVGGNVYSDPYVAMDDYVARLVPDWEFVDYGLDFISYSVGGAHQYPRFLCYQCHGFRPYSIWNPYRYSCVDFRVVVYDDPYFYPSRRYRPDRVVMVGPRNPTLPRFEFKERAAGDRGPSVSVVRRGDRDSATPEADRWRTNSRAGPGRVASPPVSPRPATTPRPDRSDRDDPSRVRSGGGRAIPPPPADATPRRPTLERRPVVPDPGARRRTAAPPRPVVPRPTQTQPRTAAPPRRPPQPDRPSTRRPAPTSGSGSSARPSPRSSTRPPPAPSRGSSARPAPRSSTRRPPASSVGSSSARSAPRARPGTPPARGRATRPPQGE